MSVEVESRRRRARGGLGLVMGYLAMYGGFVVGALIFRVERRLQIEPGVLLVVYLVGLLFGCLMGV